MRGFTHLIFVLATMLFPAWNIDAHASSCSSLNWYERDGALYVDPATTTRVRIKPNSHEIAVRLIGAFETNESIYPQLVEEGRPLRIVAARTLPTGATSTVLEILAVRAKGRMLWTIVFNGERGSDSTQLVMSNFDSAGPFNCEEVSAKSSRLSLDRLALGASEIVTHHVTIPDEDLVYKKLGL